MQFFPIPSVVLSVVEKLFISVIFICGAADCMKKLSHAHNDSTYFSKQNGITENFDMKRNQGNLKKFFAY